MLFIQVQEVKEGFIEIMIELIKEKTELYGDFIFGMMVATSLWLIYHRFVGIRNIKKSYELRIESKNETISALKKLVYEKLDKIDVPELNQKGILGKIKKSFNVK